jgi:hypothetical protein
MSLFQTIVDAISNPQTSGSHNDLQGLLNLAQSVPALQGAEHQVVDVVGNQVQSALAEKAQTDGQPAAQQALADLANGTPSVQDLQNFIGADRFNAIISEISSRTGLGNDVIMGAIPIVLPAIFRLLATGTNQNNTQAPNPVLNQFLSGSNGGALLTEVLQLAGQFVKK